MSSGRAGHKNQLVNLMTTHCSRCAHDVEAVRAWPGFVWAKRGWYAGIIAIACLAPVIFSEITMLLPLACAFGLACGPVHALAAQAATCRDCGGPVK
ncbi:MAG: hypothetical protein JWN04_2566 [Myxococcaceae bacterium]|nr:hypothetical protein [Myxococcaceae bacterium]